MYFVYFVVPSIRVLRGLDSALLPFQHFSFSAFQLLAFVCMCGIAAIFNYRTGEPLHREELLRVRDAMTARGPDGSGEWLSPDARVGLAHRRLSIIDLSPAGAQPMQSPDGKGQLSTCEELVTASSDFSSQVSDFSFSAF